MRFEAPEREHQAIEDRLRAARATPDTTFVEALVEALAGRIRGKRRDHRVRLGIGAVATASLLGTLGAFGQLGYAASGIQHAFDTLAHASHASRSANSDALGHSSAADQYPPPPKCVKKAKRKLAAKDAAARRAYARTIATARELRRPTLRKCHTRKCTATAERNYAKAVRQARRKRDAALKRNHAEYLAELKKCRNSAT
jgi:hypothetical protein